MHIHANKSHKYHTCVQYYHSNVKHLSFTKKTMILQISLFPIWCHLSQTLLLSQRIDPSHLSHLNFHQQETLLNLLGSFLDCFSDIPVFLFIGATLLQNDCLFTRYLSNFALRFRHSFMNCNHWGIIRLSKSPMASPIICVLKGKDEKGGMCLAIDYRYINKFTISDAYPTSDFADNIQEVENAQLSSFDATKGYYQILVRKEDR